MNKLSASRLFRLLAAVLALLTICACSALRPAATPHPTFFSLDSPCLAAPEPAPAAAPTLIINPPIAAAGFDSPRIIYVRESYKLEYFAHSEWVDPPARMLTPLLVTALDHSGAFRAVVLPPSAAAGDLWLDTEIIRLQHEFLTQPSNVRFTLRAYLIDDKTRRVLAWRQFEAAVAATSEDPFGGVVAANRAIQSVLEELAVFCAQQARSVRVEK